MNSTFAPSVSPAFVSERSAKPALRHLVTAARLLLGLMFFVFGLNGFFNFIPPPPTPMPERALSFITGLMGSGYLLPLIAGIEVLAGALLLANRFVPLALVLLAPLLVNILGFHLFLEPNGTAIAVIVLALEVTLLWWHRRAFTGILAARA